MKAVSYAITVDVECDLTFICHFALLDQSLAIRLSDCETQIFYDTVLQTSQNDLELLA